MTPQSNVFNMDCMIGLKAAPDKFWDLAVVDPMYIMPECYLRPGSAVSTTGIKRKHNAAASKLSKIPPTGWDYYNELVRVSKYQIIWGINYYPFAAEVCGRIVWDKKNDDSTFSNCELASNSMIIGIRIFRYRWNGMLQENMRSKEEKIHPFQKPVALYNWCLINYAEPGFKILDTHMGSQSSRIASYQNGFDYWGYELDPIHFTDGCKRFEQSIAEPLFDQPKTEQGKLL